MSKVIRSTGRNTVWEQHVLWCVHTEPELWPIISHLSPATFERPEDRAVFSAMHTLADAGKPLIAANIAELIDVQLLAAFDQNRPVTASEPKHLEVYLDNLRTEAAVRRAAHEMDKLLTSITDGDGAALEDLQKLNLIPVNPNGAEARKLRVYTPAELAALVAEPDEPIAYPLA